MDESKKALKMTSQLSGHFQIFFFFFINISRTNSKTSKVNQQSVKSGQDNQIHRQNLKLKKKKNQ